MSKHILCLAFFLSAAFGAQAQDKIFLNDGTQIDGKVKEINSKSVVYRREDAPSGPDYVLTRKEVSRIVYESGSEEKMVQNGHAAAAAAVAPEATYGRVKNNGKPSEPYGSTILSFAPIQMTNESAVGVGIQFEHFLDHNGMFSLYLPVAFAFYNDDVYNGMQTLKKDRVFTYLYPGMKIYPGGSNRKVSYSVGPSIALGFGKRYHQDYNTNPNGVYVEDDIFKTGFLVNNGLNIQPTSSFYIGLEFGLGILYYSSHEDYDYDQPLVQFQFKMGYRL